MAAQNSSVAASYKTVIEAGAEAPWLAMVHGMSGDHRVFSAQVAAFKARCRIVLIDLPGHGLSHDVPGPFGHAEMVVHVAATLAEVGAEPCHYWATHTGTALGLLLAIDQSGRFRSMILEGAVLPGHVMPAVDRELKRARDTAGTAGVPAALKQWFDDAAWFDVMRANPEACRAAEHWAIVAAFSGPPWLYTGAAAPIAPIDGRLASLDVPVLLYNGDHDLGDFVDVADRLEALLPRVTRATIADAGGFPAWEFPDRVNRLAEDFMVSF